MVRSVGKLWISLEREDCRYADQTWEKFACRLAVRLLTNSFHIEHFPGTKWHKHRKLVTPTFHFSILDTFIPVFQKQANVLISKIQSHIQEPWIDIVPLMSLCTLDIICETAMGVSMNLLSGENCDYSEAMHEIERAIMYRTLRPWLYPDIIFYSTSIGKQFKANLQLVHGLNKKERNVKVDFHSLPVMLEFLKSEQFCVPDDSIIF
ncbi:Cytochrome P450 4C1 [Araneus ventricosus]|uniref:Cytochrome P450 4C1 n=1 Tax=Araneus ventricosus TaxID=182803 RepID=A0A4Y2GS60_ARAVE|nr:Cytochrome P450 4C1 [Araneus ventricosus]